MEQENDESFDFILVKLDEKINGLSGSLVRVDWNSCHLNQLYLQGQKGIKAVAGVLI